jgi:hypothetical protein
MKETPSPKAKTPVNLLELLRAMKKRPMMYLGYRPQNRVSIWDLKTFIDGFQSGRIGTGADQEGDDILDVFTFWVCLRKRVSDGSMDWSGHLWRQCGDDDGAAFRMFFELFEEYVKDRAEIGPENIKARFIKMLDEIRERSG